MGPGENFDLSFVEFVFNSLAVLPDCTGVLPFECEKSFSMYFLGHKSGDKSND